MTQHSLAGMRWSALAQGIAQVAQYGSFILLARLLSPHDFGTIASATLVMGLVSMLNEMGLGAAIIQREKLRNGHLNACFWVNALVGILLWGLMSFCAPWVAQFFNNQEVAPVVVWLAFGFPLAAVAVVPKSLMERALRFKALGIIEALAAVANGVLSIVLALHGAGVWSLVFGSLAGYVVQGLAMAAAGGWWPGWRFSQKDFSELFSFGINVLGSRLIGYINGNIDYLLIGRFLGPAALGAYSLGYKLVTWPMFKISHVTLRVVFPAFARMQGNDEALRTNYLKLINTLALATFPLLVGLAVLAPEAIPLVFGAKWQNAVPITQILCVAGVFKALCCSVGTIFMSKGRPDLELKINLGGTFLLSWLVFAGLHWGIEGIAVAVALANLIWTPVFQGMANTLLGLSWKRYLAELLVPVMACCVLGAGLFTWRLLLGFAHISPWLILLGSLPLGAALYPGALSLLGFDWLERLAVIMGRPLKRAGKHERPSQLQA